MAHPITAADIMDVIRGPHWVTRDEAIALIEQYAAVVAGEAAIKATEESYARFLAITDEALSKPLATPHTLIARKAVG